MWRDVYFLDFFERITNRVPALEAVRWRSAGDSYGMCSLETDAEDLDQSAGKRSVERARMDQ